ncbi:MAG: GNAT family N-acetyltransferase [Kofleriaceae bacterium]
MDLDIAKRLERTEGTVCSTFVEPRNRVSNIGAAFHDFGGTGAVFDGADSPLTQTFGLDLFSPVRDAELVAIEAWFAERGADANHEVSPFASIETMQALVARGYKPIELSSVLVQPIAEVPVPTTLRVRRIDPDVDGAVWADTSVAGWAADPAFAPFMRAMADVNLANRAMSLYLVERDGEPIATGAMGICDDVALVAGASTIPSARGQGAQAALLAKRLADARARGCTAAMMVTNVGTTSQRNAERNGFRVAYTRTKWHRPRTA